MSPTEHDFNQSEVVNIKEVMDFDSLLERVGGDEEFLQELFDIFLEDSSILLSEIRQNIESKDCEALSRTAHKLKGSISNFVPDGPVFKAAKSLEFIGIDGKIEAADDHYNELTSQLQNLHKCIKEYMKDA